jgi:hypothetical protein
LRWFRLDIGDDSSYDSGSQFLFVFHFLPAAL